MRKQNVLWSLCIMFVVLLLNACGQSKSTTNDEKKEQEQSQKTNDSLQKALENSDEGTMSTNEEILVGRWVCRTIAGYEIEFKKDGQRYEYENGVLGGNMPYGLLDSCDGRQNNPMGEILLIKYSCYRLEVLSGDKITIENLKNKKKDTFERKK